jgi:hypothetical protein
MSAVVSVLGLIAVAAGIAAFGFGLTIKEFSFGSTLMIAGMTALIGGLLLVALGAAIRELHRIGTILASRQSPRVPRPGEAYEPYPSGLVRPAAPAPHMAPVPPPPVPEHDRPVTPAAAATAAAVGAAQLGQARESHAPEPQEHEIARHDVDRDVHEPTAPKYEAHDFDTHAAETHEAPKRPLPRYLVPDRELVEPVAREAHAVETGEAFEPAPIESEPEQIPLWPHERTHGERFAAAGFETADLAREPEEWEPVFGEDHAQTEDAAPPEEPADETEAPAERHDMPDDAAAARPQWEKPTSEYGRLSSFDAIWPASERIPPRRYADPEMDAPDAAGRHGDEEAHRPASEAPAITPSDEPEPAWSRGHAAAEPADSASAAEQQEPPQEPPHAVSILKSGTVDGMGYALYSDGSIEAELPSGKIRFASINELREHLEKAG